jgi:hypothetical protein
MLKLPFLEYLGAFKLGDIFESCLYEAADFFFRSGYFGDVVLFALEEGFFKLDV